MNCGRPRCRPPTRPARTNGRRRGEVAHARRVGALGVGGGGVRNKLLPGEIGLLLLWWRRVQVNGVCACVCVVNHLLVLTLRPVVWGGGGCKLRALTVCPLAFAGVRRENASIFLRMYRLYWDTGLMDAYFDTGFQLFAAVGVNVFRFDMTRAWVDFAIYCCHCSDGYTNLIVVVVNGEATIFAWEVLSVGCLLAEVR